MSTGIHLEKGDVEREDTLGGSQLQVRVEKLEEENAFLKEKVAQLTSELQHLLMMVGVLMASHNAHTTMIESHWLALNDLHD